MSYYKKHKTPYNDSLVILIIFKMPLQVLVLLLIVMQIHLECISPYINLLGLRGRTWFVSGKFPLALKWVLATFMYSWDISFTQQVMDWGSGITEGEGRVILVIMIFAQPLWRGFMVLEPLSSGQRKLTLLSCYWEKHRPTLRWIEHLWFSKSSSASWNYPFLYILNVLTCFASSVWDWCHILETEGRVSKTQNMSRGLMRRDICICWNGKWAYLWADRPSHPVSLAAFHFQCSDLQSLQHWLWKYNGLIISPTLMISFFFQLNKVHCYINMSYFSSGEFVHPFSLQESIQTWKPQAEFM